MSGFKIIAVLGIWALAILLLLNLLSAVLKPGAVLAQRDEGLVVGRYQIAAWAAPSGGVVLHHHGYLVLDTATGKIIENVEIFQPGPGSSANFP